ncbi:hypothetical protein C8R44DRAFT_846395 [Mycena epipterygia]|nr:hypothetical protein C8R44DRAFT_846395 [Mycena epipterygia]
MPLHPSLRFDALETLPLAYRRMAKSAARGSLPDLRRLVNLGGQVTQSLLPVWYANLDAAGIPTVSELDASTMPSSIERAVVALDGVHSAVTATAPYPEDAAPDLFARVWPWLKFLHVYRECVPGLARLSSIKLARTYLAFSGILAFLHEHSPTGRLMDRQAGVRAVCTRTWMLVLDVPKDMQDVFTQNPRFMMLLNAADPNSFREIVEEAGGRLGDVAALVVKHLTLAVPRSTSLSDFLFFSTALTFLEDTEDIWGPFNTALLSNGIIGAFVKATCTLGGLFGEHIQSLRGACLLLLNRRLTTYPGYTWTGQALEAGLLRAIILCATLPANERASVEDQVQGLLERVMHSMAYYSIMSRIVQSFRDIEELEKTPAFLKSFIYPGWKKLKQLFTERLALLGDFDLRKLPSFKACDNLKCDTAIGLKSQFRRCGSCQSMYYCSAECQTADWTSGGHRATCHHLRSIRLREPPLSTRERSFFRALLHHDYEAAKPGILRQQVLAWTKNPAATLYTSFDYSAGAVVVRVSPIPGSGDNGNAEARDWAVLWKDYRERAARSGGKMELHLLVTDEGNTSRRRLFVMRSATGGVDEAKKRIVAGRMPREERDHELRAIASMAVKQIH